MARVIEFYIPTRFHKQGNVVEFRPAISKSA